MAAGAVKPASWNLPTGLAIVPGSSKWPCEFSDWQVSKLREYGTVSDVLRVDLAGWPRWLAGLACAWIAWTYRGPKREAVLAYFAWPCGYIGLLLAWRWGVPLTIYEHTSPAEQVTRWPLAMAALRQAVHVISPHKTHAEALSQVCGRHVGVVPNAINVDHAHGGIVFVGRYVMQKGVDVLIEASRALPEYDFHLIGSGPMEGWLRARALDNVTFHKSMDHASVLRWLVTADLVVVPSRHESFGLIVAEACALGVPVLATDAGVHREAGATIYEGGKDVLAAEIRRVCIGNRSPRSLDTCFACNMRVALYGEQEEPCSQVAGCSRSAC